MADTQSELLDPGQLVDGELELVLVRTTPADPTRGWVPHYEFEMRVGGRRVGEINIRAGNTRATTTYQGHLGYAVDPEHRGHRYAERACRLLFPLARAHGLSTMWITCHPDNAASRCTCERLGAILVEIADIPEDTCLYQQGVRQCCRYRTDLA